MTYRDEIVARLERHSEEMVNTSLGFAHAAENEECVLDSASYATAALKVTSMAEQFKAGNYDEGLMADYASIAERPDLALDLGKAADEVVVDVGFDTTGSYEAPDDVLSEIVRRARL